MQKGGDTPLKPDPNPPNPGAFLFSLNILKQTGFILWTDPSGPLYKGGTIY